MAQKEIFVRSFISVLNGFEEVKKPFHATLPLRSSFAMSSLPGHQSEPCRARTCKRLRSLGIASEESIPPGWESIPGLTIKGLQIRAVSLATRKYRVR